MHTYEKTNYMRRLYFAKEKNIVLLLGLTKNANGSASEEIKSISADVISPSINIHICSAINLLFYSCFTFNAFEREVLA